MVNESALQGELVARFRPALALLSQATSYADQTNSDPWEFAVGIDELQSLGLFRNDLRLLAKARIIEHASEVSNPGCDGRQFQSTANLSFTRRTCFILTAHGLDVARKTCESGPQSASRYVAPIWSAETRELLFGGVVVKRFKSPAKNQEAILAAFEEEGWPPHIADPIPPHAEQDSRRRLLDSIKCLNRHQVNKLLCFHGDGSGEGVIWERVCIADST